LTSAASSPAHWSQVAQQKRESRRCPSREGIKANEGMRNLRVEGGGVEFRHHLFLLSDFFADEPWVDGNDGKKKRGRR
jgi:hypothetical protein